MTERAPAPGVRLQKVLARAGVASRRTAERLIEAGRVRVDGRVARELGVRVDPRNARVEVDGKRIVAERLVYVVLNKPRGVVCTLSDPEGRPTVAELLRDAGARVLPVGRLDFNTGGALLCTNDGEFANGVAHPRHHAPKEYLVKVGGAVDERALEAFRESISIEGRATRPAEVRLVRVEGDKSWLAVRLEEGKNRQVRRLAEHAGFVVMRLVRTSHAGITVESVPTGRFRQLTVDELTKLRDDYGVPRRIPRPMGPDAREAERPKARGAWEGRDTRGGERPNARGGERPNARGGERPNARGGERRDARGGERSNARGGERSNARGGGSERRDTRGGERPNARGGERPKARGGWDRPDTRGGERPNARGGWDRPDTRGGERPNARGPERSSARGGRAFSGRRGT